MQHQYRLFQTARLIVAVAVVTLSSGSHAEEASASGKKLGAYLGAAEATHPAWFKESFLDFNDDIDEAAEAGKRLAIYFYQRGCPYCNQLWAHNMAVGDIEKAFSENFDVVAINMWGDQDVVTVGGKSYTEKQLAEALDVNFTPTLLFYTEDKQQALRLNGYYPPEKFRKALQYVIDKQEKVLPFSDYMRVAGKSSAGEAAEPRQPFFMRPPVDINRQKKPGKRPLAVYFEPPNCPECERLHEVTFAKHPDTLALLGKMQVVQLNPQSEAEIIKPDGEKTSIRDWVRELNLGSFPSMAFFDENGKQVMLMETRFHNFHTQSIFAYVIEKAYLTQPNFQRWISARAEHIREQGVDVDIWEE